MRKDKTKEIEEPLSTKMEERKPLISADRTFDDLITKQDVRKLAKVEKTEEPKTHISDGKRSCAVISTIPKCDRFVTPESDQDAIKEDKDYSSFGGGKSMFDGDYQQGLGSDLPSVTTDEVTTNETDDELELEDFEMFERSKDFPKLANLARSHSELNNFEINTFEGNGRPLTSRSGDFTFAMNRNLTRRVIPGSSEGRHNQNDTTKSKIIAKNGASQLPAFLTNSITWEREDILRDVRNESRSTAWRLGQPGACLTNIRCQLHVITNKL